MYSDSLGNNQIVGLLRDYEERIQYQVTAVSRNAFKNNKKVTAVKLGSNIAKVGASAFWGCKKLLKEKELGKK